MEEPGRLQSMGLLESDTIERLHLRFSLSCIVEGNGNPLQYSCLESPRDWGAWWAAVYGVVQSWTRLKRLSSSSSGPNIPGSYMISFFTASHFTSITSQIHNWALFSLWLILFILSGAISLLFCSSILDTY